MASSIDDGGLEFRGTDATLKLNRGGFSVYREGVPAKNNPVVRADSFEDGTISHLQNFFDCIKSRKEPNAPVETGIAAARAGHIANLAYHRGGQLPWPPSPPSDPRRAGSTAHCLMLIAKSGKMHRTMAWRRQNLYICSVTAHSAVTSNCLCVVLGNYCFAPIF
jgi:hypothetical protein